jgi:hypothetical protein
MMSDDQLLEHLIEAASAAIQNERPGICYDRRRLRGVIVELEVTAAGVIVGGQCYIQRALNVRHVLGATRPAPVGQG